MKAFRWVLVGLLLLSAVVVTGWMLLVYFGLGITDGFSWLKQHYPALYPIVRWSPLIYPISVFASLSFHFTCEKRWPYWTLLGLLLPFILAVICCWVALFVMKHDTRGQWVPFHPKATDYICSPTRVVRVASYGYSIIDYTPKSISGGVAKTYQQLQLKLGDSLKKCKNKQGHAVPVISPATVKSKL
ncbi:MAG: hypothetical protein P1U34_10925 [Coxiellaceae bacterium]|nr:hypothetical protein [Coxiellaceae bacterium]